MNWIEVRVQSVVDASRDAVVAALVHAGAPGVQEVGGDLLTHLPETAALDGLTSAIVELAPGTQIAYTPVGEIDWATQWPTQVGIQRIGPIAVAPPWLAQEISDAEFPVVIDPAMAFGTGEHETTRSVLRLMPQVVRAGDMVADLGAGSAVLSIAAAKLGATRVAAIELDPDAIENAEGNVTRNGVDNRVTVVQGDAGLILPLIAPVRVILANIISSVLLDLAPVMREATSPGGQAIISGILVSERDAVSTGFERAGWRVEAECIEGEWWSSVIARQ